MQHQSNKATAEILLKPEQAADSIEFSIRTLNNSRYTGMLGGVKAPPYIKIGRSVRYRKSALDNWLAQFQEQTSTSEDAA